jgi:tRNA nucleotidyltransferase/poly(A) polymerase
VTANEPLRLSDAPSLMQGPLAQLLAVLDCDGEEARAVGGAVRNALLGEPHGDIDVATTALPEEVVRRAGRAGFKAVPTGIDHGTVTVIIDGEPFQVTTLRKDIETFGRKAAVRFGRDWKTDAERRDFTMNGLSVSRDGTIHDDVGGLADLHARRVRFIGDPQTRIREDYLRILRFFRFHAAYGRGELDRDALLAATALREGIDLLSRERIRMELIKLLLAPGAAPTLQVMTDTGILGRVLAGVPVVPRFARLAAVEERLGLLADAVRRLGALAVFITEDAERLWERLRLSNSEHERLASMAEGWWHVSPRLEGKQARALLYRLGPERYRDRVLHAWAHAGADPQDHDWRKLTELPDRWQAPTFSLRAADLIKRGVEKGPALGAALAAAEAAWIAADFPAQPSALDEIADEAVRPA